MILALETSCDETAAAVVDAEGSIRANVVASQAELHAPYGGVVPEVASRRHLELAVPVVERALADAGAGLDDLDAVAVTEGPGLIGALLVGLASAKAIAFARGLPLVPVDHLHGHIAALYLQPRAARAAVPDAAGLGRPHAAGGGRRPRRLPGDRHDAGRRGRRGVRQGRAAARPRLPGRRGAGAAGGAGRSGARTGCRSRCSARRGHDFSFSGLKTALLYAVREGHGGADLAASYQRAIVRSLVGRTMEAVRATGRGHPGRRRRGRPQRRAALGVRGGVRGRGRAAGAGAARAVLRQRGDDRVGRQVHAADRVPGLPRPRRVRLARRMSVEVVLYGAPDCGLCIDAKRVLESQAAVLGYRAAHRRHQRRRRARAAGTGTRSRWSRSPGGGRSSIGSTRRSCAAG